MYSTIKSRTGNKSDQVCCTGDGWTRAFPKKKEREAHAAPYVMVMYSAKAQVEGDSKESCVILDATSRRLNHTLTHIIWVKVECKS
jgi:hypothetical protein